MYKYYIDRGGYFYNVVYLDKPINTNSPATIQIPLRGGSTLTTPVCEMYDIKPDHLLYNIEREISLKELGI